VELVFRWCPPGKFMMGSPLSEKEHNDDESQVSVEITRGFWMLETEVTQELYEAIAGNNPSDFKSSKNPVENVRAIEADNFAVTLTTKLREAGLLPSDWTAALPTEAQWEYAYRAGPGGTGAYGYGDDESMLGQYAWFGENSGGRTHPVGQKAANGW